MKTILAALTILSISTPLQAQVRSWVATSGLDTNPCTRTEPCRNFSAAIAATSPGGEVVVIDSGGYGFANIHSSITIVSPEGVHAAVAPTGSAAFHVDAAGAVVVLRNLYLNSQGAISGVRHSGGTLHLENLVIDGFIFGIDIIVPSGKAATLVNDSTMRNNIRGLFAQNDDPAGGIADVIINRSRFLDGDYGAQLSGGSRTVVRDSSFSGNQIGLSLSETVTRHAAALIEQSTLTGNETNGLEMVQTSSGGGIAVAFLANSVLAGNGAAGIRASGSDMTLRVSNCTILHNIFGMNISAGATVVSRENNTVTANVIDFPDATPGTFGPS